MKKKLNYIFKNIRSIFKFSKYYDRNEKNPNAIAGDLIRKTHSIEKGLCLKDVRLGFGHKKHEEMMRMIEQLEKYHSPYFDEAISMAASAINYYIKFHDEAGYTDDFIEKMRNFIKKYDNKISKNFGGTINLDTRDLNFNISEIERFITLRHSVRTFSSKPIDESIIKKAVKLAQSCPSACNRQATRVYVIDKTKAKNIIDQLEGVGGFANSIDKLILITGKLSSYTYDEINQYIVSSSIYAGYLSLALHLYGLGSCTIQRPVIWNKNWENIRKEYNISDDEQIICMIGAGNIEGIIKVPVSNRISLDEFVRFIK